MKTSDISVGDWVEYSPDAPYRIEGRYRVASLDDVGLSLTVANFEGGGGANVRNLRRAENLDDAGETPGTSTGDALPERSGQTGSPGPSPAESASGGTDELRAHSLGCARRNLDDLTQFPLADSTDQMLDTRIIVARHLLRNLVMARHGREAGYPRECVCDPATQAAAEGHALSEGRDL